MTLARICCEYRVEATGNTGSRRFVSVSIPVLRCIEFNKENGVPDI